MSHDIDFTTGAPAIAYQGNTPWHGYGEEMEDGASLEQWRKAAGLDWRVVRKPAFCSVYREIDEDEVIDLGDRARNILNYKKIPNKHVLLRSDSHDILSMVSDRYKIVQPKQVLGFFKSLIDQNGFKMHTAGALRGGRRIWALAETGRELDIDGDRMGAYLLLATSYDGKFSTTAQFTSVRVVCNNTLTWSLEGGPDGAIVKIPHNQVFDEVEVKLGLGLDTDWTEFERIVRRLAAHSVTDREALEFFFTLLGVTEDEVTSQGTQLLNVKKLVSFYSSAPGADLSTAKGTAWGLVNAVSFFTDHSMRSKNEGTRFDSASFGTGAKLKRKALTLALELVRKADEEVVVPHDEGVIHDGSA